MKPVSIGTGAAGRVSTTSIVVRVAARVVVLLEKRQIEVAVEKMRAAEAGDAGPDNRESGHCPCYARSEETDAWEAAIAVSCSERVPSSNTDFGTVLRSQMRPVRASACSR